MASPVFLHNLTPDERLRQTPQLDIIRWLARAHAKSESLFEMGPGVDESLRLARYEKLILRLSGGVERIRSRASYLPEVGSAEVSHEFVENRIYSLTKENGGRGKDAEARSNFYSETARAILGRFYPAEDQLPAHLIHTTCTGYVAPSAPQRLLSEQKWNSVPLTHAYHMSCYASLPSIRLATALVRSGTSSCDIVHTELCTLHMNPSDHTPEQLVVQSLFGDGAIRYRLSQKSGGFEVLRILEKIVPDSSEAITWISAGFGLKMTLSTDVPEHLALGISGFVQELLGDQGLSTSDCAFAIHPGGPKIIDSIQAALGLRDDQTTASREVLARYGNISSATLPYIWNHLLESNALQPQQPVVSLAFGPGLTLFGALFRRAETDEP